MKKFQKIMSAFGTLALTLNVSALPVSATLISDTSIPVPSYFEDATLLNENSNIRLIDAHRYETYDSKDQCIRVYLKKDKRSVQIGETDVIDEDLQAKIEAGTINIVPIKNTTSTGEIKTTFSILTEKDIINTYVEIMGAAAEITILPSGNFMSIDESEKILEIVEKFLDLSDEEKFEINVGGSTELYGIIIKDSKFSGALNQEVAEKIFEALKEENLISKVYFSSIDSYINDSCIIIDAYAPEYADALEALGYEIDRNYFDACRIIYDKDMPLDEIAINAQKIYDQTGISPVGSGVFFESGSKGGLESKDICFFAIDENQIYYGNLNDDNYIDLTDLTELSLYLLGDKEFNDTQIAAADVNADGNVNIADLAYLRLYLNGTEDLKLGR